MNRFAGAPCVLVTARAFLGGGSPPPDGIVADRRRNQEVST